MKSLPRARARGENNTHPLAMDKELIGYTREDGIG